MKRKSDNTNDPPAKYTRNPLNKCVQSPSRTQPRSPSHIVVTARQKSSSKTVNKTAEQMSYMKADKTKDNYTKVIQMFNKFADQQQDVPLYEDLTESNLTSSEENLGLKTILHDYVYWLLKEK
eukprot:9304690-Ditylum_brightwellii.AAC.1